SRLRAPIVCPAHARYNSRKLWRTAMDRRKLKRALVRICSAKENLGTGFLLGKYIVTAAHCLPVMPEPEVIPDHPAGAFIVPLTQARLRLMLYVVVCDPCSDVAILGPEVWYGDPVDDWDRFERWRDTVEKDGAALSLHTQRLPKAGSVVHWRTCEG